MKIYKITNKLSGKIYVGQTTRALETRLTEHSFSSSGCKAVRDAILKYGIENFSIEEIASASSLEELNTLEKHFITELNSLSPAGYNLKNGGDVNSFAPETLEKMRDAKLGSSIPEEVKDKMSTSHKKRFADPALRQQRSEQSKLNWANPKYRETISDSRKTYWEDPENRTKASNRAKALITDEYKEEISQLVTESLNTPEIRAKILAKAQERQISVVRSDGVVYASLKEAAEANAVSSSSINKCIKGRYKKSGGYSWTLLTPMTAAKPKLYLVCGVSGSGKSWVCNQLKDKYEYLSSDSSPKKGHVEKLKEMAKTSKPLLYDLSVSISTFIKNNAAEFDIYPIFIKETREVILARLAERGTGMALSDSRLKAIDSRTVKYGKFSGTTVEVLKYLEEKTIAI